MSDTIKFLKVRDVKSPSRAHKTDAGIDFYIPELTDTYINDLKQKNLEEFTDNDSMYGIYVSHNINESIIVLPPQRRILLPSGIHCQMKESGRALIAFNKSGIASNLGLVVGAAVVDFSYQGEIHLNLINTSTKNVELKGGMKIVQFIEMPIFNSEIEVQENLSVTDFYKEETTRGAGGFGSTSHI